MSLIRLYYHIARADLLERTRRYSFLVSMLIFLYIDYLVFTGQLSLSASNAQGMFNSAWLGTQMTLICTTMVSFIGFYLVKGSIQRDERTGVGQIIATTPLTSLQYLLGKWISNLLVLAFILAIMATGALVMQIFLGSPADLDLWKLLAPFVLIGLPMMSLTAAVAITADCLPFIQGGLGNLVYFFVWTAGLVASIEAFGKTYPLFEPFGYQIITQSMTPAITAIKPDFDGSFSLGFIEHGELVPFFWDGITWTPEIMWGRVVIFWAPLALVVLSSLFFGRFDPARRRPSRKKGPAAADHQNLPNAVPVQVQPAAAPSLAGLPGLKPNRSPFQFANLVFQYLRLMIKGLPWWFYLLLGGAWLAVLLTPFEDLPVAVAVISLLPVLVWSRCGPRESLHDMRAMTFCTPRPLARLFFAEWLAALLVTGLIFSSYGLRLGLNGSLSALIGLALGVLLIPSAATALGGWSGSSKLFEVVYVLVWYLGIANQVANFDYLGISAAGFVRQTPLAASLLVFGLLLAALLGRRRLIYSH